MPTLNPLAALLLMLTLAGCASPKAVPVAVICPPSPPIPQVLTEPASTGPSLSEQWANSINQALESLRKAIRAD